MRQALATKPAAHAKRENSRHVSTPGCAWRVGRESFPPFRLLHARSGQIVWAENTFIPKAPAASIEYAKHVNLVDSPFYRTRRRVKHGRTVRQVNTLLQVAIQPIVSAKYVVRGNLPIQATWKRV